MSFLSTMVLRAKQLVVFLSFFYSTFSVKDIQSVSKFIDERVIILGLSFMMKVKNLSVYNYLILITVSVH